MAIKELQDAYNKLTSGKLIAAGADSPSLENNQLKHDIDECKVAVKKLAESITTVKNVLNKKILDEVRKVCFKMAKAKLNFELNFLARTRHRKNRSTIRNTDKIIK